MQQEFEAAVLCYRCGHYAPDGSPKCPGCGQVFTRTGAAGEGTKRTSSQRVPQAIFSVGETVAERYRILDVVGAGGVGAVYRAHDTDIDVDVALKAVAPKLLQTPDEQKTFSKFIKTARKLHHANIVRIYDEGRDTGPNGERRFFTMQLLEGLTLRKIIQLRREKNQVFTVAEVEPIFAQLAAALDYAHKTTWHGDLKPENVLVLPDLLKVTDFCIIQALPTKPFLAIQKSRGAAYHYIAPEVRLEASRIDGRADVYSMGVILSEMLTGQVYEGHQTKDFQAALSALPKAVEQLLRKATHESPDARPQSAGELSEAVSRLARGDLSVAAESTGQRSSPPPPPVDSGPHDVGHIQREGSIPELSASSVIMIQELQEGLAQKATTPNSTDITEVPDELVEGEEPEGSDQTPVVGLPRNRVESVLEVDTDEQKPRHRKGALDHQETPPEPHGRPSHEDTAQDDDVHESETVPGHIKDIERAMVARAREEQTNRAKRNGHAPGRNGLKKESGDNLGPPPPLPDDPSDSGRMVGGSLSIHDEPTQAEKGGKVPIYDALTSLRPNPARPPSMPGIPLSIPPQERPTQGIPTGPAGGPSEPPRDRRKALPLFVIFPLIGLIVGTAAFFIFRNIRQPDTAAVASSSSGAPVPQPVPVAQDPVNAQPAPTPSPATAQPAPAPVPAAEDPAVKAAREAEEKRKAEAAAAELKRVEEEKRKADEDKRRQEEEDRKRLAQDARQDSKAEEQRKKDEARAELLARKQQELEEKQRQKEEAAAEKRRKEDEAREAREAAAAEKKRRDEDARREREAAEAKRKQEEEDKKKAQVAQAPAGEVSCPKGMAMIAAGSFAMGSAGSDPMHNFEEKRLEQVNVPVFCVDYYEFPNSKAAKPTTGVSWFQAQEMCKGKGKRLCSEEEWEKACKGEGMLRYPYGNEWDPDRCNTQDSEGNDRELAEQKAFPKCRSGYGLINMSGNASEWVMSNFSATNKDRVHKGGAANRPDWATRCANRANLNPSAKNPFVGFRCCADPVAAE